jgi:UDP-N-acetylglucosamine--dolichyl-phosphate N-acetylglucosaminephosphotransferase
VDVALGAAFLGGVSFITVLVSAPQISRKLSDKNVTSLDLHKTVLTNVPNIGGLSLILGFSVALSLAGGLPIDTRPLLVVYIVGILAGLLGIVDDFLHLSRKTILVASLLIGVPFVTYQVGSTIVILPVWGPINLRFLIWPLALLGVSFLSNAVNIYAGFNGLEAGCGLITSSSLAICAALYGSTESSILLVVLAAGLLAFLRYNIYPSKIFIGNSGTYLVGACLAASIIVGDIKTAGILACFPYIVNFLLRARDGLRWSVGETTEEGLVVSSKVNALWSVFIYRKPQSERFVVLRCWLVQLFFGAAAVAYSIAVVLVVR